MSLTDKEQDIKNLIVAGCHTGGKRITKQMKKYVYSVRSDGIAIFDVNKIYEKIQAAARIIASSDAESIIAVSARPSGQRAIYKFGYYTKAQTVSGRWSPGMLTNQITKKFVEPRLLIVNDPRSDFNALVESSYVNIPVIAICNTDNNLKYVDCAIPCNNRANKSVAMIWYLLTKAVMNIKNQMAQFTESSPNEFVNPDLEKKKERKNEFNEENEREYQEEEKVEEGEGQKAEDEAEGEDDGEENFIG